jgi:hypothetical protein
MHYEKEPIIVDSTLLPHAYLVGRVCKFKINFNEGNGPNKHLVTVCKDPLY